MRRLLRWLLGGPRAGPLDQFRDGAFECGGCRRLLPFADLPVLSLQPCPKCGESNFVPRRVAGYWLFAPLGSGGMGSVYQAYHQDAGDTLFAVKILPRERQQDPRLIQNLEREIVAMRAVGDHPCLVAAVSAGDEDGVHYLVTRFVRGERLDLRIARLGKVPERETLLIALRVLGGLAHVYNRGYLFRDMKPQNVIVGPDGARIFDFGICLSVEAARRGGPEHVAGSALYYPPERLTGDGEGAYSEIYSLGMVLYHALTGSPYFTARDVETMTTLKVRKSRLIENNDRAAQIRPDLSRIVERMIKREPAERYQSFIDVEHDLLQALVTRA